MCTDGKFSLWLYGLVLLLLLGLTTCGGGTRTTDTGTTDSDTTAPTVTFRSPSSGATGVAVDSTISVVFSEAMDTSTITISTFTVDNAATGTIAFSGGNTIATLTPSSNLLNNTTYTVSLGAGIENVAGNSLSTTSWSFVTSGQAAILDGNSGYGLAIFGMDGYE